MLERRG